MGSFSTGCGKFLPRAASEEVDSMPRPTRIHMAGALCYVTSRAPEGAVLFKDARDYQAYLGFLKAYQEQFAPESPLRFDVIAIDLSNKKPVIEHFVDAFYPVQ